MPDPDQCKSCHASIRWLKHEATGKLAPIDTDATVGGNIVIDLERGTYAIRPRDLLNQDDAPRHKSHFGTCVDAKTYRRKQP